MSATATQVEVTKDLPTRIQRSRAKGSKLPPNTICCTRPGQFSNPYAIGSYVQPVGPQKTARNDEILITRSNCLIFFEEWARQMLEHDPQWLEPLRKAEFLACWCAIESKCHVDIIIRLLHETATVREET